MGDKSAIIIRQHHSRKSLIFTFFLALLHLSTKYQVTGQEISQIFAGHVQCGNVSFACPMNRFISIGNAAAYKLNDSICDDPKLIEDACELNTFKWYTGNECNGKSMCGIDASLYDSINLPTKCNSEDYQGEKVFYYEYNCEPDTITSLSLGPDLQTSESHVIIGSHAGAFETPAETTLSESEMGCSILIPAYTEVEINRKLFKDSLGSTLGCGQKLRVFSSISEIGEICFSNYAINIPYYSSDTMIYLVYETDNNATDVAFQIKIFSSHTKSLGVQCGLDTNTFPYPVPTTTQEATTTEEPTTTTQEETTQTTSITPVPSLEMNSNQKISGNKVIIASYNVEEDSTPTPTISAMDTGCSVLIPPNTQVEFTRALFKETESEANCDQRIRIFNIESDLGELCQTKPTTLSLPFLEYERPVYLIYETSNDDVKVAFSVEIEASSNLNVSCGHKTSTLPIPTTSGPTTAEAEGLPLPIVIGSVAGAVFLFIIILVLMCVLWSRRKKRPPAGPLPPAASTLTPKQQGDPPEDDYDELKPYATPYEQPLPSPKLSSKLDHDKSSSTSSNAPPSLPPKPMNGYPQDRRPSREQLSGFDPPLYNHDNSGNINVHYPTTPPPGHHRAMQQRPNGIESGFRTVQENIYVPDDRIRIPRPQHRRHHSPEMGQNRPRRPRDERPRERDLSPRRDNRGRHHRPRSPQQPRRQRGRHEEGVIINPLFGQDMFFSY